MTEIPAVEVRLHVPAAPEDVFPYFTDPARYVQWMGSEAKLEPVPGGVYRIHMPDGFAAAGEFLQVTQPYRVVFSCESGRKRRSPAGAPRRAPN